MKCWNLCHHVPETHIFRGPTMCGDFFVNHLGQLSTLSVLKCWCHFFQNILWVQMFIRLSQQSDVLFNSDIFKLVSVYQPNENDWSINEHWRTSRQKKCVCVCVCVCVCTVWVILVHADIRTGEQLQQEARSSFCPGGGDVGYWVA